MKLQELFDSSEYFKEIVNKQIPELNFDIEFVKYKKLFKDSFRESDPPSATHKFSSGVYIFCDNKDNIIYIGKAANGNLAFRIWDHLKTPNDVNQFEKSPWVTNHAYDKQARVIILKGNFTVSAIVVEPKELSSLLEVYLQTIHYIKEKKNLPVLNSQIG